MSKTTGVKYKNKKGVFTLTDGVLTDSDGNRTTASKVSTRRDPLIIVQSKASK